MAESQREKGSAHYLVLELRPDGHNYIISDLPLHEREGNRIYEQRISSKLADKIENALNYGQNKRNGDGIVLTENRIEILKHTLREYYKEQRLEAEKQKMAKINRGVIEKVYEELDDDLTKGRPIEPPKSNLELISEALESASEHHRKN